MRRISKKILIALFVSLLFITNVRAFEVGEIYTLTDSGDYVNNITFNTGDTYTTNRYFINKVGGSLAAFCIDPGFSTPTSYRVKRLLVSDSNKSIKPQDYGILHILSSGGANSHTATDYGIKTHAMRLYADAVLGWGRMPQRAYFINDASYNKYVNIVKSYATTAYKYITENGLESKYTQLTGHGASYILSQYGISSPDIYYANEGDITPALTLVGEALQAAIDYKNGDIKLTELGAVESAVINGEGDKKVVVIAFTVKNFPAFDLLNHVTASCSGSDCNSTNVVKLGFADTFSSNWEDYDFSPTQLVGAIDTSKTVYAAYEVDARFVTAADGTKTSNAVVNITYKVPDAAITPGTKVLSGAILEAAYNNVNSTQRFAVYEVKGSLETSVSVSLKDAIDGPRDEPCEPDTDVPAICSDDAEIDVASNTVKYSYKEGVKDDELQILRCVIDPEKDYADNPIQLIDSEYSSLVGDNPYCAVYCKEDYEFTLPYKQYVDNGRYFKVNMSIKGQQDCYSSKVNKEKFDQDMVEAQKKIVEAYNKWLKNRELSNVNMYDNTVWEYVRTDYCYATTCREYPLYDPYPYITDYECGMNYYYDNPESVDIYRINLKGDYYTVDDDGNVSTTTRPDDATTFGYVRSNNWGSCSYNSWHLCENETYSCDIVTAEEDYENNYKAAYETRATNAYDELKAAVRELKIKIDQYNGCMGDHNSHEIYSDSYDESNHFWDMILDFEPEVKYSYNEPEPDNISVPKWIDEVRSKSCNGGTSCDVMQVVTEEVQAEKCRAGSTNCVETTTVELLNGDEANVTEYCKDGDLDTKTYKCSNPLDTVTYTVEWYFSCEEDDLGNVSCGEKPYQITNLSYVHKVAVASGDYDTARVFYSHHTDGAVEIYGLDETAPDHNYDQVKGLPVSINTPQGTYFYILSIDKIGKFFSEGYKLGRIYGTSGSAVVQKVHEEEGAPTTTSNGDSLDNNAYACTYVVSENTCTDNSGNVHDLTVECMPLETVNECKARVCPGPGSGGPKYCVKEAEAYYACDGQNYDPDSCDLYSSSEEVLNLVCGNPSGLNADGSICEYNYNCKCPNCTVFCINCIINFEPESETETKVQFMLNFNAITPARVNINDRQMGYNWDVNNAANVLVARKAANTISEIEARANIANVEGLTPTELRDVESYDFKVTLTPAVARRVREYNREQSSNNRGSYNNETLECYDYEIVGKYGNLTSCESAGYTWKNNQCVMQNIFCYSSFIDELIGWGAVDSEVVARRNSARTSAAFNYYSLSSRLPHQETEIVTNDYWTIYIYNALDVNNDGVPDIGPSWK